MERQTELFRLWQIKEPRITFFILNVFLSQRSLDKHGWN